MSVVQITTRAGSIRELRAMPNWSLMQIVRDNGIDEVQALCGGFASCGTCHVYVDAEWLDRLPPIDADEEDMLACSSHRSDCSRLACQIRFTDALDGLSLTIAPEE
jgi:2Fe-2S ferredoxin